MIMDDFTPWNDTLAWLMPDFKLMGIRNNDSITSIVAIDVIIMIYEISNRHSYLKFDVCSKKF